MGAVGLDVERRGLQGCTRGVGRLAGSDMEQRGCMQLDAQWWQHELVGGGSGSYVQASPPPPPPPPLFLGGGSGTGCWVPVFCLHPLPPPKSFLMGY